MFNLPNLISFSRIPLALCLFQENPFIRSMAIIIALATDGLDGYLARRFNQSTPLGTLLDPFTDKFFVILAGCILMAEGRISLVEICMLICRDFSVVIFGCYLFLKGHLSSYRTQAIWCGKITTVLQFAVLFALVWGVSIPFYAYGAFVLLGVLALFELYFRPQQRVVD